MGFKRLTGSGIKVAQEDSEFIWLGSMIGNRKLPNVAPASDAALIPEKTTPQDALDNTLVCLKQAVNNNYVAAFVLIASAALAMHYETVLSVYGMCPTPVAVGPKGTGKSTVAKAILALFGTPQFFVRDFTATQTSVLNSRKTFPSIFDDPSDIGKVKSMIDNSFNAGARCTSRMWQGPSELSPSTQTDCEVSAAISSELTCILVYVTYWLHS